MPWFRELPPFLGPWLLTSVSATFLALMWTFVMTLASPVDTG